MNFMITPLISGMFNLGDVERTYPGLGAQGKLIEALPELKIPSSSFSYVAYNYLWENGPLPAFTTPNYTLLPVHPATPIAELDEAWDIETTLYEAILNCESVDAVDRSNPEDGLRFNINWKKTGRKYVHFTRNWDPIRNVTICEDRQGTAIPSVCDQVFTFTTPWTSIAQVLYFDDRNSNDTASLFAWASGRDSVNGTGDNPASPGQIKFTAILCTYDFVSVPVEARVKMPEGDIKNVNRTGTQEKFTRFNFERMVNLAENAINLPPETVDDLSELVAFGYFPTQLPNMDSQLQRRLGKSTNNAYGPVRIGYRSRSSDWTSHSIVFMDKVVSIAPLALSNLTANNCESMLDPVILAARYKEALQLWFALAVAVEMVDNDNTKPVAVIRHLVVKGYVVDRLWARGSQGCLLIVVLVLMVLSRMVSSRVCSLDGEPNTLAEALRLLAASPELIADMENSEFYSPMEIQKVFDEGGGHYLLLPGDRGLKLGPNGVQVHATLIPSTVERPLKPWKEKLWALRTISGVGFIFAFALVLAVFTALFVISRLPLGKLHQVMRCVKLLLELILLS